MSSHVLSDAEALCSRVAILAKGRLVTAGRLADMVPFHTTGWDLVVSGVSERMVAAFGSRIRRAVRIDEERYSLELSLDPPPAALLAELTAAGAHLVSINPIRQTLEDFFVQQVTTSEMLAADRGVAS